jgi:hypothetical protein
MEKKLTFAFDDEPVGKFCYDMNNKKIEIHFTGHYDLQKGSFIEGACTFVIENWKTGKSKLSDDPKLYELNKHFGVFRIILSMQFNGDQLEILVNTVDDRYVLFFFSEPELTLK